MEEINKLIEYLIAIQNFCRDLHYTVKGESFYSKHLLADRIQENLNEYLDQIKEIFFLASYKEPLPSGEYLSRATSLIPQIANEDKANFVSMQNLLVVTLEHIESLQNLTKGEENLIGAIAQDLQNSLGLVNLQVKD
jgi:DNA-binding ferritin-like protein